MSNCFITCEKCKVEFEFQAGWRFCPFCGSKIFTHLMERGRRDHGIE